MSRRVYVMGKGDVLISHGLYSGLPCIALASTDQPGTVGDIAHGQREHLMETGTVIAFSSLAAMEHMLRMLVSACEDYAAAVEREAEHEQ